MSSAGVVTREQALALHRGGRLADAEQAYRAVLHRVPDDAAAQHGFCVLLLQLGRDADAEAQLTLLLQRTGAPPAWALLAQLRRRQGRIADALAAVERARIGAPGDPSIAILQAGLLLDAGDDRKAQSLLEAIVRQQPAQGEAWHLLGQIHHRAGAWNDAIAAYREALRVLPQEAALHFNLGLSAEAADDLELARTHLQIAEQRAPTRAEAVARLAAVQARLFDVEGEAESVARLDALLLSDRPRDPIEPFLLTFLPLQPAASARALGDFEHRVREGAGAPLAPAPAARAGRARLRVAYLSPDLGHHAVGGLMRDVFAAHDRGRVEVFAYAQRLHTGDTADAIRAGCDVFRDVSTLDPRSVAQRIRADGVDVLIDLGGYTRGADARVLALRPAPRQVAYLGFIHDYGAEWIDAHLLDAVVAPEPSQQFTHRVVHLPGTMLPAPRVPAAADADRAAFGLPEDVPVFASFNTSYKLDAALLRAWLAIHRAAPQVRFLLVVPAQTQPRLLGAWRAGGGAIDALQFGEPLSPARHAQRAASCDLLLDAFRYHAGATAIASVGAGLPILCVPGRHPLARLSASVNAFLGLDALVCATPDAYVRTAVELAHAPQHLRALRTLVRQRATERGLFDPRRTAAGIEDALDAVWARDGAQYA